MIGRQVFSSLMFAWIDGLMLKEARVTVMGAGYQSSGIG
jgi:hypothetical protein